MNDITLENQTGPLARPYILTRSRLGTSTKLYEDKFLCTREGLYDLHESLCEKFKPLNPDNAAFQYLVSYEDKTHFENTNLDALPDHLRTNSKVTERLVMKWVVDHKIDGVNNELQVVIRISNPVNPFIYLQAALSKSPEDMDNLEFEAGSLSVSVSGAGQILTEEIFSLVGRWAESRPQPQYLTNIHDWAHKNQKTINLINYWLFPLLTAIAIFMYLRHNYSSEFIEAFLFAGFVVHFYAKDLMRTFNSKIERWTSSARHFSVFSLTGGDSNRQTKLAEKSRKSLIKLVGSLALSVIGNLAAAYLALRFF